MTTTTQVTVQDKLLKFDNLLSGLELLTEEVRTRKDLALSDEHLEELITNVLDKDDRMAEIVRLIVSRIGNTAIIRGVTREIKAEFETHIDTYIAQQLTEPYLLSRLDRLIAIHAAGGTVAVASPEPEARSLEELSYETVDDIVARFKILAGDDAWV